MADMKITMRYDSQEEEWHGKFEGTDLYLCWSGVQAFTFNRQNGSVADVSKPLRIRVMLGKGNWQVTSTAYYDGDYDETRYRYHLYNHATGKSIEVLDEVGRLLERKLAEANTDYFDISMSYTKEKPTAILIALERWASPAYRVWVKLGSGDSKQYLADGWLPHEPYRIRYMYANQDYLPRY